MSTNQQLEGLRQIINALDQGFLVASEKTRIQKQLFLQYIKIFQKFSQKLALLANKINQQVLSTNNPSDQSIVNIFQHLSNTLLRMADCSRKVAIKSKNQIFQPIKVFSQNYGNLNAQILKTLKYDEQDLQQKNWQLIKIRQAYINSSEKLQKQRQVQSKMMTKIQNGDMAQLQKFNQNIKKITQNINVNQQNYGHSVKAINSSFLKMRKNLNQTIKHVSHNQQSRISFCQKNVVNSIKIIQDFSTCFDPVIQKKIQQSLKSSADEKGQHLLHKKLSLRIAFLATSKFTQEFISFQQIARRKRKKSLEQQNSYLYQIFNKVKQTDKQIMQSMISPWFIQQKQKKQYQKQPIFQVDDIDLCKQKIMSVQPYSFYFIQQVYQKVQDLTSFYCKLDDQNFLLLLNIFQTITNNLQTQSNTTLGGLCIQLLYKMTQISMRIMWRKNKNLQNKAKPIQLLCQQYAKRVKKFNDPNILTKLLQYIQKKKAIKKRSLAHSQSKGVINSFAKGLNNMLGRKKQVFLSDDQIFNCLQQLTIIMANLLVPTQISLLFIKQFLGNNENSRSFQYLKGILFAKKDQQQRQKIFYRTQVKQKKQQKMRKVIQTKKVVQYCLWITAKRGFFDKSQLNLRLVSTQFKQIHQQILCRLQIITQDKWIHMIPFNKKVDYVQMKQAVAQNSVPSSIQQIITLDVNRSLHNHGQYLNPTILHSLLRTYAYFHKQTSYCQGMNYIAGYLYIKTKNQENAYRIFQYMMQLRFRQLFANQFQALKFKMYQFQRLLAIFHPQISDHFKKQSITSQCYIVSWMITLFASSYQYTMQSYLIDVLWQRFIVWGWRQFFRFVLSLFNLYKEQLIQLTYDKALHFLGEMGKSKMFLSDKKTYLKEYPRNQVVQGLQQYPITQQMLQNFLKEYKLM